MIKPIEMIGTMILNGADDLLAQYKAIDFPVKRYFILDNSMGKDEAVRQAIVTIQNNDHPFIEEVSVVTNRLNVGFSGSVNQIIKQNTDCPYWCILSVDWHPQPGQLVRLANRLMQPFAAILCDETQNGYSSMVFTPALLQEVGFMDENFFPAYYEDNDHRYRMKLVDMEWEIFPLQYTHAVSSTLKRDNTFIAKNQFTFKENNKYYVAKWGGPPGQEVYETPFDLEFPLDYWIYDPTRSQNLRWI
jgi:GT2 family glycosyltransferase